MALATKYGRCDVIPLLVAAGARVDVGWEHQTPLLYAVRARQLECVTILLNYGASIDQPDEVGQTLLHIAARKYDAKMIHLLAEKGSDLESTDRNGDTPLLAALLEGRFITEMMSQGALRARESIEALLVEGVKLNLSD